MRGEERKEGKHVLSAKIVLSAFKPRISYMPSTFYLRMCWVPQLLPLPWRSTVDQWQCVVLSCSGTKKKKKKNIPWHDFPIESSGRMILSYKTDTRHVFPRGLEFPREARSQVMYKNWHFTSFATEMFSWTLSAVLSNFFSPLGVAGFPFDAIRASFCC